MIATALLLCLAMARFTEARILDAGSMRKLLGFVRDEFNVKPEYIKSLVPFTVEGREVGLVKADFASTLSTEYSNVFVMKNQQLGFVKDIETASFEAKTQAFAEVNLALKEKGFIPGWRDELLPLGPSFNDDPYLKIERAACSVYGVKGYGVHVNGFVRDSSSREITHIWVGKRAKDKSTWPGMLDHIVAGGQPFGIGLMDNVIKECEEEANIPRDIAATAKPVGAVSYCSLDEIGNLRRDCLFCYDLELPPTFVPTPLDNEVECFELKDVDFVIQKVVEGSGEGGRVGYKPNCNLVLMVLNSSEYPL